MTIQLQLLAAVFVCTLFAVDCNAQNINQHDKAVLEKVDAWAHTPLSLLSSTKASVDASGNITSVKFNRINGDFDSLLELEHLKSIHLFNMKSGWLEKLAKRYPDLERLNFHARGLTDDDLAAVGGFKNLTELFITGGDSDGAACMRQIGELKNLKSLTIPPNWGPNAVELKALKKLPRLNSCTRVYLSKSGERVQSSRDRTYHHFYRLLVDEQKRSVVEASEFLGILNNGRISATISSAELIPYLNGIETANSMSLTIGEHLGENINDLRIPSGLKTISVTGDLSHAYKHFYRSLVDEEKRSAQEASEVLGILSDGRIAITITSAELIPYLNGIETATEMQLIIGEHLGESIDDLRIPSGVKTLSLTGNLSQGFLDSVAQIDSIESLSLRGAKQPSLHKLTGFHALKSLSVRGHHIGHQGLTFLDGFKKLKMVALEDCHISEGGVSFLADLEGLTSLRLLKNKVPGVDLKHISGSKGLEHLDLSGNELQNFDAKPLSNLKNLSYLNLEDIPLHDSDLVHLQNLKSLDQFEWQSDQTTARARFELYANFNWGPEKSLKAEGARMNQDSSRLSISRNVEVSEEFIKAVGALDSLSAMSASRNDEAIKVVQAQPFRELRFFVCKGLNNEAIELLSTNQNVTSLVINGSHLITDEGFQFLERMTWLESLRFRGDGVSDAAKEALKAKLPNCKIN